jgi:hypothetical protein
VRVNLPAIARGTRVDRNHDRLRAEASRRLLDQPRIVDGRRVDAHLVGARVEELADVLHRAHAAAHRERNEDLVGNAPDHLDDRVARVAGSGDVEESDLVGARLVIAPGDLHRVAGVAKLDEIHALHHAPGVDVEAGNDALRQQDYASPDATFTASAKSSLPS